MKKSSLDNIAIDLIPPNLPTIFTIFAIKYQTFLVYLIKWRHFWTLKSWGLYIPASFTPTWHMQLKFGEILTPHRFKGLPQFKISWLKKIMLLISWVETIENTNWWSLMIFTIFLPHTIFKSYKLSWNFMNLL